MPIVSPILRSYFLEFQEVSEKQKDGRSSLKSLKNNSIMLVLAGATVSKETKLRKKNEVGE